MILSPSIEAFLPLQLQSSLTIDVSQQQLALQISVHSPVVEHHLVYQLCTHRLTHIHSRCRTSCSRHMQTLTGLPLQMAERLCQAQLLAVANDVKARQSLIERAVT